VDCNKCLDNISLYIDGFLDEEDRVSFENHISSCEKCKKELHATEILVEYLKNIPLEELPEGLHANIMKGIEDARAMRRPSRFLYSRITTFAASLIIIAVVFGYLHLLPGVGEQAATESYTEPIMRMADTAGDGQIIPFAAGIALEDFDDDLIYPALEAAREYGLFYAVEFEDGLVAIFEFDIEEMGDLEIDFDEIVVIEPIEQVHYYEGEDDDCDCDEICEYDCDCGCQDDE